jgi:NTP pyrophosphatase (non-canonical NTP hydrolase)
MDDHLSALTDEIIRFRNERDWAQFHTPKNLAAALSIEAAELQESMLWKTDEQIVDVLKGSDRAKVQHEIADVLIYALLLCDSVGAEPAKLIREKLALNAIKYPVDKSRGRADKYTNL